MSTLKVSQAALWRTGRDVPTVERSHKDAAAWALDRAPDSLTWEHLTAHFMTPDRIWQANRVAEAFARFEQAIREECAGIADHLADCDADCGFATNAARLREAATAIRSTNQGGSDA